MNRASRWPTVRGGLNALTAALLFGVSTPLVQRFGVDIGSFTTAALRYAGAALVGTLLRRPIEREARVQRRDASRLALMALFGAVIGPVSPAWGLQRTSGASASLMLTLEAVFTAVLARLWVHETLDRLVILAMILLTLGGMVLVMIGAAGGGRASARHPPPTRTVRPIPPNGVQSAEGSAASLDAVFSCTGFRPALAHLAALGILDNAGRLEVEGTRSTAEPRL